MSSALAVNDALFAVLRTDEPVQSFLGGVPGRTRVFAGLADDPDDLPYISAPDTREVPGGLGQTFGRRGHVDTETLHLWAASKREVLQLYRLVAAALDGVPLPLDGHTMIAGGTELLRCFRDQDGQAHHGVVVYRVHTRVSA